MIPHFLKLSNTLSLLFLFSLACGPPPRRELEMEGMMVEVDQNGVLRTFDAQELFEEARAAFARHDFPECEQRYGQLLSRFPKSQRYGLVSFYNRGLCLEQLKRHAEAAKLFEFYAKRTEEPEERQDGEFRTGFNLVRSQQSEAAVALYDRLLAREGLSEADRGECFLRRATARIHLKQLGEAELDLKWAIQHIKVAFGIGLLRGNDLFAEAHFRRAEIYEHLMKQVRFKLPLKSMRGDLKEKARFLRQAQRSFIEAVNVQNSYWGTASGLKLGGLYERFYADILGAETSGDLSAEEHGFYLLELKKKLLPLLESSLAIYEKNITMSQRFGAQNEWVEETERRLKHIRGLMEEIQRAEDAEAEAGAASDGEPKG